MSKKSANVSVRIDPEIKEEAEAILASQGLTPSFVVHMLYSQIILSGGIPFGMTLSKPNPLEEETN